MLFSVIFWSDQKYGLMFQSEYYCNNYRYNQEDLKQVWVIVNWKTKQHYHSKFLRLLLTKEAVKINSGLKIIVRWNGVASCSSDQPTMPFWNGAPRRGTTEPICQISPAQPSLLNYSLFRSSSRSKEIICLNKDFIMNLLRLFKLQFLPIYSV